ncbi:MAG: putative acetyltransferase [Chloroflexi bacterium]|nr:putative acetyltransferase [Chloroflexota bacterium]
MMKEIWAVIKKDLRLAVFQETLFLWLANALPRFNTFDAARALILRLAGLRIKYPALVFSPLEIRPIGAARRINIGRDSFINSSVRFTARFPAEITIGERVFIGPRCCFETVNHSLTPEADGARSTRPASIHIGDDVWFGANVTVLPGVTIGDGSAIAAGAVVASDVPGGVVAGGVPAKTIKEIK